MIAYFNEFITMMRSKKSIGGVTRVALVYAHYNDGKLSIVKKSAVQSLLFEKIQKIKNLEFGFNFSC